MKNNKVLMKILLSLSISHLACLSNKKTPISVNSLTGRTMSNPDPWPAMTTSMRSPCCNSSWSVRRCSNCSEAGWCLNSRIFSPAPTTQQSGAWTHRWSHVSLRYKLNLKLFMTRSENAHGKRQIAMSQSQSAFVIFRLNFKTKPRYL